MGVSPTVFVVIPASLLFASACGVVSAPELDSPPRDNLSPEMRATVLDLYTNGGVIITYMEEHGRYPGTGCEPMTLRELARAVPKFYGSRLAREDGWGAPFLYVGQEEDFVIMSTGPDRQEQAIEIIREELCSSWDEWWPPLGNREFQQQLSGDDLVVDQWGLEIGRPPMTVSQQKITASDMTTLSIALEHYRKASGDVPVPPRGSADAEYLLSFLVPKFLESIPETDAWGNPIRYRSDGSTYLLISFGADGKPDMDYDGELPEDSTFFDPIHDLVLRDGSFVRWPKGMAPP